MNRPPQPLYPSSGRYELAIFDLRLSRTAERLHREQTEWQEQSEIEAIGKDHFVLIVCAGGARGLVK